MGIDHFFAKCEFYLGKTDGFRGSGVSIFMIFQFFSRPGFWMIFVMVLGGVLGWIWEDLGDPGRPKGRPGKGREGKGREGKG